MKRKSFLALAVLLPALAFAASFMMPWVPNQTKGPAGGGGGGSTLLTDLVSYWKLSEASGSRADSHGSNTLTDNNTVTSNTGLVYALAAEFTLANSEFLSRASNSTLQTGDIDFSFAVWVYPTLANTGHVFSKDVNASREYGLDLVSGLQPRWAINGGGGGLSITSSTTLSLNTWNLIVCWHDATADTINVQVNNGTAENTTTSGTAPNTGAAEFRIGAREYSGAEAYFEGRIGPVMFHKRLLTTGEKTAWYNAGAGVADPY